MLLSLAARTASLLRQVVLPTPFPGLLRYLQRLLVLILFLPVFAAVQLVHWLGFLADEIFFRRYRDVEIREPVFVLGVPRSGTTFMHQLLAHHDTLTTFAAWECFLAPSIAERYFWRGLAALDRAAGRPFARLIGVLERRLFAWLDDVHPLRLDAPEEDYFVFLPILACFILVVPFPGADFLWRIGQFDREAMPYERHRLMRFYRRNLQKHLYFHGADKTLLSKNASFAGMAQSLVAEFPDCRLIICERDALNVIRSQFRSLAGGMHLFGIAESDDGFRSRLLDCLDFYYRNLDAVREAHTPDRIETVPLWMLSNDTRSTLARVSATLGLAMPDALERALDDYEARRGSGVRPASSGTALRRWGLDADEIGRRFAAWRHAEELRI